MYVPPPHHLRISDTLACSLPPHNSRYNAPVFCFFCSSVFREGNMIILCINQRARPPALGGKFHYRLQPEMQIQKIFSFLSIRGCCLKGPLGRCCSSYLVTMVLITHSRNNVRGEERDLAFNCHVCSCCFPDPCILRLLPHNWLLRCSNDLLKEGGGLTPLSLTQLCQTFNKIHYLFFCCIRIP